MADDTDYEDLGMTRSVALTESFPLLSQRLHSKKLGVCMGAYLIMFKGGPRVGRARLYGVQVATFVYLVVRSADF